MEPAMLTHPNRRPVTPIVSGMSGTRPTRAAFLSQISLFASLDEKEREALAEACRTRTFKPDEVLFHEEDPGHALYMIQAGQVKVVRVAPDGAETLLHIFGPGEFLGEMSLLDDGVRSATAVALEQTAALILPGERYLSFLDECPGLARALLRRLAGRVRRLNEQVQDIVWLDVRSRLAKRLVELADQHGEVSPGGIRIAVRITQQELAQMVGAARSKVNLYLCFFEERGLLTADRDGIMLHRPQELRKWFRSEEPR